MFAEFGEISSAAVQREGQTEELKPSGFVCFKNSDDAAKALQAMNKK
jgi:RNA recognition motif-containing protein